MSIKWEWDLSNVLTAILAAGAIASFIVVYCQLQESQHALKVDQRAWVGFDEIIDDWTLKPDQPFIISVPLKNLGKTPAKYVSAGFTAAICKKGETPNFDELVNPLMGPPAGLVLPNQIHNFIANGPKEYGGKLPEPVINEVKSGDRVIFAFAKVTYTDIFNVQHCTRYCRESEPHWLRSVRFKSCQQYNDIDPNDE